MVKSEYSFLLLMMMLVLGGLAPLHASTFRVELTARPAVVTVGDAVELQVKLPAEDAEIVAIASQPKIELQRAGVQNSVTIRNGQMTSEHLHKFRFVPQEAGEYVIGPVIVRLNEQELSSNPVKVVVQAAGDDRYLSVESEVVPDEVYVGQVFSVAVTVVYGSSLRPSGWNPAQIEGIVDLLGLDHSSQTQSVVERNGRAFQALTLRRWVYSGVEGEIDLRGGRLQLESPDERSRRRGFPFDSFGIDSFPFGGRGRRVQVDLPRDKVHVKPLPAPPEELRFLGVVGDLQVQWHQLEAGSNQIRGVLELQGRGSAPALRVDPWVWQGWRVYPDKAEARYRMLDSGPLMQVRIPATLVPVDDHDTARPSWFDPIAGRYRAIPMPVDPRQIPAGTASLSEIELAAAHEARQIVVTQESRPARFLNRMVAHLFAGVAAISFVVALMGAARPFRRRKQEQIDDLLQRALERDQREDWQQLSEYLEISAEELRPVHRVIADVIAMALYAPEFRSPRDKIKSLLEEAGA